jgi:drug/metabolite transporter superfamily protein YnfA
LDKEKVFIVLQYAESICMFFSSGLALIGFYFGITKILKQAMNVKYFLQCVITLVAFFTLLIFGIQIIKSLKKYKQALKESND